MAFRFSAMFRWLLFGLLLLVAAPNVAAQPLAEFDTGKLLFVLKGDAAIGYVIAIRPKGGMDSLDVDLTARVFAISSPSRLVIDVPNISGDRDSKIDLADLRLQRVRLGVHQDKTRLVIDIKDNLKPDYSVRPDEAAEALLVEFKVLSEVMTESEPVPTSEPEVIATKPQTTVAPTPEPLAATPAPTPRATQEADETVKIKRDADALLLKAIQAAQREAELESKIEAEQRRKREAREREAEAQKRREAEERLRQEAEENRLLEEEENRRLEAEESRKRAEEERIKRELAEQASNVEPGPKSTEPPMFVVRNNRVVEDIKEPPIKKPEVERPAATPPPRSVGGTTFAAVRGIKFKERTAEGSGGVMIDVDNINTYSLNQRNDSLYELVLDMAKLDGSHLLLPQFPPEGFRGFEVLVARERATQVFIKVYVTRGTTLFPYIAGNKLWLKTEGSR